MQPVRLVLEGVSVYSERTEIDFSNNRLFAIVGPTGSGKSSIVDAICFALYGSIPRLGAREVGSFMNLSANHALVSLDFTIKDESYRAVRRLKRGTKGVKTDEASLESLDQDGEPVATIAKDVTQVTKVVEEKLGLTYEQFTRVVMLPQGAFQKLLKETPAKRQELLRDLLGTEIYEKIRKRASDQYNRHDVLFQQLESQIQEIGEYDSELVVKAEQQLVHLKEVNKTIEELDDKRTKALNEHKEVEKLLSEKKERLSTVESIPNVPQPLLEHDALLSDVNKKIADNELLREQQGKEQEALEGNTIDKNEMQQVINLHKETSGLQARVSDAEDQVKQHELAYKQNVEKVEALEKESEELSARVAQVATENIAAELASNLEPGDACPVCSTVLTAQQLSNHTNQDLDALKAKERECKRALQQAQEAQTRSQADVERAKQDCKLAIDKNEAHKKELAGVISLEDAKRNFLNSEKQEEGLADIRKKLRETDQQISGAKQQAKKLENKQEAFNKTFDENRLRVANKYSDVPELVNELSLNWKNLYLWCQEKAAVEREEVKESEKKRDEILNYGSQLRDTIDKHLDSVGVKKTSNLMVELNNVEHKFQQIIRDEKKKGEDLKAKKAELKAIRDKQVVYGKVKDLLKSTKFQAWILEEATKGLIAAASEHLYSLSQERFTMALENRAICIADETYGSQLREVNTLSGGETFLASLALALALAENIVHMSANPVALESLFIDEGFGTLDSETLDIAANALEILGSQERMVGVITHVPELANRMSLRYVVTKKAGIATVTVES